MKSFPEKTYIYCLLENNNVRYAGKSDNPSRRYKEHLNESKNKKTYKDHWINGLLCNSQKPELLILDEVQFDEWPFWESFYITLFKIWEFKLTNLTQGGDGGNFGDEINKKISEKLMGRKFSDEWRNNIRISRIGKKATKETKLKFSELRMGAKNPMYGVSRKSEWDENKRRKILQLSMDGEIINKWNSIQEAVNGTKVNRTSINFVLKSKRKHAGGYNWVYNDIY